MQKMMIGGRFTLHLVNHSWTRWPRFVLMIYYISPGSFVSRSENPARSPEFHFRLKRSRSFYVEPVFSVYPWVSSGVIGGIGRHFRVSVSLCLSVATD